MIPIYDRTVNLFKAETEYKQVSWETEEELPWSCKIP